MKTAPKRARRGFTLIEILVVIGIILILLGMVVLGFRHIDAVASKRDTVAELHVCRDLLTEYEKLNGLDAIEAFVVPPAPLPPYLDPADFRILQSNPAAGNLNWPAIQVSDLVVGNNGDVSDRSMGGARYRSVAMLKTRQRVMPVLLRVPRNRTTVASLPPKRILEAEPVASGTLIPPDISQAVILDGWGNPIIFVPRGGLHVNIRDPQDPNNKNPADYIVRTSGTFLKSQLAQHPLSPADRPFFASAGQDGDFTKGEDNIYSFQD